MKFVLFLFFFLTKSACGFEKPVLINKEILHSIRKIFSNITIFYQNVQHVTPICMNFDGVRLCCQLIHEQIKSFISFLKQGLAYLVWLSMQKGIFYYNMLGRKQILLLLLQRTGLMVRIVLNIILNLILYLCDINEILHTYWYQPMIRLSVFS